MEFQAIAGNQFRSCATVCAQGISKGLEPLIYGTWFHLSRAIC
jgi:hypothetical protein